MKKIIDNETGEIIEVEESNDLAERKLYEVGAIDEYTNDFLNDYFEILEQYEIFKEKLQEAMIKNNIKSWKNKYFTATLIGSQTKKSVDTERLKNDGLYDKYLRLIEVKPSVSIRRKK